MPLSATLHPLLEYVTQHPEQVATAATAVVGTTVHYSKTGKVPLGRLPWRALRQAGRELGDQYFGTPRPKGVPGLLVDTDLDTLEQELRAAAFESVDLLSYEYAGEALNMRRPNGTRTHPQTGEAVPMELHPRVFQTKSGVLLILAHDEASRFEATDDHLEEDLLSWERGRNDMVDVLEKAGLQYTEIGSERKAGVDVQE